MWTTSVKHSFPRCCKTAHWMFSQREDVDETIDKSELGKSALKLAPSTAE